MSLIQEFIPNPEFIQSQYRRVVRLPKGDDGIDLEACTKLAEQGLVVLFPYLSDIHAPFVDELKQDIRERLEIFQKDAEFNRDDPIFVHGSQIPPDFENETTGIEQDPENEAILEKFMALNEDDPEDRKEIQKLIEKEQKRETNTSTTLEAGNLCDLFYRHFYVVEALKFLKPVVKVKDEMDLFKMFRTLTPSWNAETFHAFQEIFLDAAGTSSPSPPTLSLNTRITRAIKKYGGRMRGFLEKVEYVPDTNFENAEDAWKHIASYFSDLEMLNASIEKAIREKKEPKKTELSRREYIRSILADFSGYITFFSLILRISDLNAGGYLGHSGNLMHSYNLMQYMEASLGKKLFDEEHETSWHWVFHEGIQWRYDDMLDLRLGAIQFLNSKILDVFSNLRVDWKNNIESKRRVDEIGKNLMELHTLLGSMAYSRPDSWINVGKRGPSAVFPEIQSFLIQKLSEPIIEIDGLDYDLKTYLLPQMMKYIDNEDEFLNIPQIEKARISIEASLAYFEKSKTKSRADPEKANTPKALAIKKKNRREATQVVEELIDNLTNLQNLDMNVDPVAENFLRIFFAHYGIDYPITKKFLEIVQIELPKNLDFKEIDPIEESLGSESEEESDEENSDEDMEEEEIENKSSPEPIPIIQEQPKERRRIVPTMITPLPAEPVIEEEPTEETDESPEFDVDALLKNIEEEKPEEMNVESEEGTEVPFDMDAFLKNIAKPPNEPEPELESEPAPAFDLDAFLGGVSRSMQALPSLEVRPSEQLKKRGFSTLGLFAAKSYGKGEWIAPFSGEIVSAEEFEKIPAEQKTHAVKIIGKDKYILGVSGDLPDVLNVGAASVANDLDMEYDNGMWVKNSTNFQNVKVVRREKQLGLQTIRPIAKGEEISVAYDPEWRVIQNHGMQSLDISTLDISDIQDAFPHTKSKFEALRLAEDRLDDPSTKERLRELFEDLGEEALDAIDDLEDFNFDAYEMVLADLFVQHELRKLAQKIIGTPEQWRENRRILLTEDQALAELSKMAGTLDFRLARNHLEHPEKLRTNMERLFKRAFPDIPMQLVFDILESRREILDRVEKRQRTQSALAKAVQRAKSQSKYRSTPTVFLLPRRSPMGAVKPEIIHYPLSRPSVSFTRGISDHLYLSQKDREKLGYLVDHLKDFENRQEVLETLRAVAAANQLAAETDEYPLVSDDPLQTLYETVENPKAWTVYAQVFEDLKNLYPKHQNFLNLMFSALSESDRSSDRERILEILQKKLSSWQALDTDRPQSIQKRQRTRNRIKTCRV